MIKLKIIIASTRDGRKGPAIADWVYQAAAAHGSFEAELLDLLKINLPFLDEPNHPRFKKYQKQHTWDWSAIIDAGRDVIQRRALRDMPTGLADHQNQFALVIELA